MTNLLAFLIALPLTWNSLTTDSEIPSETSLRGIAVSDTGAICVAGGKPHGGGPEVWVSTDHGKSWQSRVPDLDGVTGYRSVAMPSHDVIVLASAGTPAVIMRSNDLGKNWTKVLHDKRPEAFIDSVRFWDHQRGIAMGDPVAGSFWLRQTDDGGETWRELSVPIEPLPGEAGFAASNGSVCLFNAASIAIGLGGRTDSGPARLLRSHNAGKSWSVTEIAAIPANASSGIFSVSIREDGTGIAAGGDYKQTERASGHIGNTVEHGATWRLPTGNSPRGFRSSVIYVEATELTPGNSKQGYWLATGPSGSETSVDGENWEPVAGAGFHALTQSTGQVPFASGSKGRVADSLGVQRIDSDKVPAPIRVHQRIITGGLPTDDSAMRWLADQGVKTIVSVDGMSPNVAAANEAGMAYIHLPIGYDRVSPERAAQLAKVIRDREGCIYIHCHHGKHRAPAAAAVACVAAGLIDSQSAQSLLQVAGTSERYSGLFDSVRQATLLNDVQIDQHEFALDRIVKVNGTASSMVRIQDHLDKMTKPNVSAEHLTQQAVLMHEEFRELLRSNVESQNAGFQTLLQESRDLSEKLSDPKGRNLIKQRKQWLQRLVERCDQCHEAHRN